MMDMILVGNELIDYDVYRGDTRKSMFDKNVVFQRPILEASMDYVISHIGLMNESTIDYPVMITEPLCNPNYSRNMVSELMFECYGVKSLAYGVDSMMAFYGSNPKQKNGLII
jgi:actin-related protein 5